MDFMIVPLDESHMGMCGIYRIWFGDKFYVGATMNTTNRMGNHLHTIRKYYFGSYPFKNSATNIVNHLKGNEYIQTGFYELLEECKCELDLVDAENDWLSCFLGDRNCLNYSFTVHRTIGNIIVRPNGDFKIKKCGIKSTNNPKPAVAPTVYGISASS
jgi:hypothetical protein